MKQPEREYSDRQLPWERYGYRVHIPAWRRRPGACRPLAITQSSQLVALLWASTTYTSVQRVLKLIGPPTPSLTAQ